MIASGLNELAQGDSPCSSALAGLHGALRKLHYMRYRSVIYLLLCAVLLLGSCHAQTSDWQAVQNIPAGSYIFVKSYPRSARCFFENATDNELFCKLRNLRTDFHRENIRQVRLERPHKSPVLGMVIGEGIGAAAGVLITKDVKDVQARFYTPILFGSILGAISGIIMAKVSTVHGTVIYRK